MEASTLDTCDEELISLHLVGCRGKGWDFVYAVKIYSE